MKRALIITALMCFVFSGSLMTFVGEQRARAEEYGSQKEGFQKKAEAQFEAFKQKIEDLKIKAADLKKDSKEKYDQEMEVLKKKQEAAKEKLEELKSAGAESWKKVKAEFDSMMEDLNRQYEKVKSHFKKT